MNSHATSGGCEHTTWETEHKTLILANNQDPFYEQEFETAQELAAFIRELIDAGIDAFGHDAMAKVLDDSHSVVLMERQ